jgi:hypothetical protein
LLLALQQTHTGRDHVRHIPVTARGNSLGRETFQLGRRDRLNPGGDIIGLVTAERGNGVKWRVMVGLTGSNGALGTWGSKPKPAEFPKPRYFNDLWYRFNALRPFMVIKCLLPQIRSHLSESICCR